MGRDQDHSLSATAEYQGHCYGPQIPLATAHAALLLPPGTGCHHSPTAAAAQEAGFAVHRDGVSPCRWSESECLWPAAQGARTVSFQPLLLLQGESVCSEARVSVSQQTNIHSRKAGYLQGLTEWNNQVWARSKYLKTT